MIAGLGVVIVLLLAVIVWQYQNSRKASNDLRYMHDKLSSIMEEGSHERLLLFSGNLELQNVLIDLNRLLDINHKGSIERVRLEKSMRNMLSNISHDLKTPLTVVLGYIETIQQDEHLPAEERERMMKMIHQKANEVIQLMNKFFDLSKLESGDREVALSRVEAGEVCRRNILSFYDILSAKGSEVEIEFRMRLFTSWEMKRLLIEYCPICCRTQFLMATRGRIRIKAL